MEIFCVFSLIVQIILISIIYIRLALLFSLQESAKKFSERNFNEILYEIKIMKNRYEDIDTEIQDKLDQLDKKMEAVRHDLDQTLLALKASYPPYPPITTVKPNNWDSMREAFKGPVRVEIDERN